MSRRGLVLGGGGVLGAAWLVGALTALEATHQLDARDFDVAIANARAQLAQARLQVRSTQASYAPRAAELKSAQNDLAYRQKELARQQQLTATEVGSRRELDERTNDVNVAASASPPPRPTWRRPWPPSAARPPARPTAIPASRPPRRRSTAPCSTAPTPWWSRPRTGW